MNQFLSSTAIFEPLPGTCPEPVEIDSWSTFPDTLYLTADAEPGAEIYTDRSYEIDLLPPGLVGRTLVQTANDDKNVTTAEHLYLNLCRPQTLYVAYDRRASVLPEWLRAPHWALTSMFLETSDSCASPMPLFKTTLPAGPIVLGGNRANGGAGASSNYLVLADDRVVLVVGFESGDVSGWSGSGD